MCEKKFMYDFKDFQNIIDSKGKSYLMDHTKFTQFMKEVSKSKDTNYRKLEGIRKVKCKQGSTTMVLKTALRDIEWCSGELVNKNYRVAVLNQDAFIPRKSTSIVEK